MRNLLFSKPARSVTRSSRRALTAAAVLGTLLLPVFADPAGAQEAPPPVEAPPATEAPPVVTTPPVLEPTVTVPANDPVVDEPVVAPTKKKKKKVRTTPRASTNEVDIDSNARGSVSVEVSIARQTMYLKRGGRVWRTLHVSTGSGRRYCEKGKCGVAITPRGTFRIYNRVSGWRTGALGRLYNPLYFRGGFAIHGAGSVPSYPASHGCVRVSIGNARWLPSVIPNGTPVYIH